MNAVVGGTKKNSAETFEASLYLTIASKSEIATIELPSTK